MTGLLKRLFGRVGAAPGPERQAPGERAPDAPDPARRQALFAAGVERFRAGDFGAAAERFERCLEIAHDDAEAHLNLGLARQALGLREDAADCFALALHFAPRFAEAHFNLGVLDLAAGEYESAAGRFEAAIDCRPDYAEALSNLGLVQFRHLGRIEQAEAALGRALAARPRFADALTNLAMLRHDQGRFDEARRLYDEALRQDPALHEARLNRSLIDLARGRYARGWEEYEARKLASAHFVPRFGHIPEWDGAAAAGRTLLVYGEQGLGDEIMFASCLPDVIAAAMHCVIDCSPKLEAIFRRSFPGTTVHGGPQIPGDIAWLAGAPAVDARIAIGSLPRLYRPDAEAFPRHGSYLRADAQKVARWRERLGRLGGGLKVGLSWRGGAASTRRASRSVALEELLPVVTSPGADFVSLQYTDCREELARFEADHGVTVHHWQDAIDDYDETAALVSALDLVVSVQTAVVHLAGALGTPAWVMVPAVPEWRYSTQGAGMPWYPAVRLFRQTMPGAWAAVIECLADELKRRLGAARADPADDGG